MRRVNEQKDTHILIFYIHTPQVPSAPLDPEFSKQVCVVPTTSQDERMFNTMRMWSIVISISK